MKVKCSVYKCTRKAETYLYLKTGYALEDLPEGLRHLLGPMQEVLQLDLDESRTLAQVNTSDVIEALHEQGYFLQMPPQDQLHTQTPGARYIQ